VRLSLVRHDLSKAQIEQIASGYTVDPNRRAKIRAETAADPAGWVRTNLPGIVPLEPGPHHRALLEALDPAEPSGVRTVLGAPRGSGKSTTALVALPLLAAVRGSHRFVVVIRDNLPDARTSVAGIRTLLESDPTLTTAYPELRPLPGEQSEIHLAGGTIILARSTGSAIRGLQRVTPDGRIVRPDLVIADDLEDDASARSALQTDRLEEWLLGTVGQLGGPPGAADGRLDLVAIGTTLEVDALVSRMLDGRGPFAGWDRRRFPASGIVARIGEEAEARPVVVDTAGEATGIPLPEGAEIGDRVALWPEGQPLSFLDRLSDPADPLYVGSVLFAREYDLRPRNRSDALFLPSRTVWARFADEWLAGRLPLEREATAVDPAVSVKQAADWTAVAVVAVSTAGAVLDRARLAELDLTPDRPVLLVPYVERRRTTPGATLAWVEEVARLWTPAGRVTFEAEGGFAAMADELHRGRRVAVKPVLSGGVDKRTRAVPLSIWQEGRRLIVDERLRGSPFDLELHAFTGSDDGHDDTVDAVTYGSAYATNAWRRR
jgi:hypothetical protein